MVRRRAVEGLEGLAREYTENTERIAISGLPVSVISESSVAG